MKFTVTYRDPNSGGKKALELDVPSKSDVWPILKDQGITAISVTPGAVEKKRSPLKFHSRYTWIFVLIVGCIGVTLYFCSKKDCVVSRQKSGVVNSQKITPKSDFAKPRNEQAKTGTVKKVNASITNKGERDNDPRFPYNDGRKVISSVTNNWDQIIDICIMPDGKRRKVIRSLKPPTFSNISDQILAVALSGDMDGRLPPIPIVDNIEEEFVKSLTVPIEILDDDTEAVKESKRRVMEAREIIREEMKKGRGFREILDEHLAMREANAEAREIVMEGVADIKKSGDPELLNQYLQKANEHLRNLGAREVNDIPTEKKKGE
jgi:hypothetical protein